MNEVVTLVFQEDLQHFDHALDESFKEASFIHRPSEEPKLDIDQQIIFQGDPPSTIHDQPSCTKQLEMPPSNQFPTRQNSRSSMAIPDENTCGLQAQNSGDFEFECEHDDQIPMAYTGPYVPPPIQQQQHRSGVQGNSLEAYQGNSLQQQFLEHLAPGQQQVHSLKGSQVGDILPKTRESQQKIPFDWAPSKPKGHSKVIQSKKSTRLSSFSGIYNLQKLLELQKAKKALDPGDQSALESTDATTLRKQGTHKSIGEVLLPLNISPEFATKFFELSRCFEDQKMQLAIYEEMETCDDKTMGKLTETAQAEQSLECLLKFLKMLELFQMAPVDSEKIFLKTVLKEKLIRKLESLQSFDHDIQYQLFRFLPAVHAVLKSEFRVEEPSYDTLWQEEFNYLNLMLLRKLTFFFAQQTQGRGVNIINMLLSLKDQISSEWLEDIVKRYCYNNRMVLPQDNWTIGQSTLLIIEVLKKLRGIDDVFELLDDEHQRIQRRLNEREPLKEYIEVHENNMKGNFIQETIPIQIEGVPWWVYSFKEIKSLKSYMNPKYAEDLSQVVGRLFEKQVRQFAPPFFSPSKASIEDGASLGEIFNGNYLDDRMNFIMENDLRELMKEAEIDEDCPIAKLTVQFRPHFSMREYEAFMKKDVFLQHVSMINENKPKKIDTELIDRDTQVGQPISEKHHPPKNLIFSYVVSLVLTLDDSTLKNPDQYPMSNMVFDNNAGERVFSMKPQLVSQAYGAKQVAQLCELWFPQHYMFDQMNFKISLKLEHTHQVILRYIVSYFANLPMTPAIGLLKYEQFILILKSVHLFAPNEDTVLEAVENWVTGNVNFKLSAKEQDQHACSSDNGKAFNLLGTLLACVNWPQVSLRALILLLIRPGGSLREFSCVFAKVSNEIQRRERKQIVPKGEQMPLRKCQIAQNQAYPKAPKDRLGDPYQTNHPEYNLTDSDQDESSAAESQKQNDRQCFLNQFLSCLVLIQNDQKQPTVKLDDSSALGEARKFCRRCQLSIRKSNAEMKKYGLNEQAFQHLVTLHSEGDEESPARASPPKKVTPPSVADCWTQTDDEPRLTQGTQTLVPSLQNKGVATEAEQPPLKEESGQQTTPREPVFEVDRAEYLEFLEYKQYKKAQLEAYVQKQLHREGALKQGSDRKSGGRRSRIDSRLHSMQMSHPASALPSQRQSYRESQLASQPVSRQPSRQSVLEETKHEQPVSSQQENILTTLDGSHPIAKLEFHIPDFDPSSIQKFNTANQQFVRRAPSALPGSQAPRAPPENPPPMRLPERASSAFAQQLRHSSDQQSSSLEPYHPSPGHPCVSQHRLEEAYRSSQMVKRSQTLQQNSQLNQVHREQQQEQQNDGASKLFPFTLKSIVQFYNSQIGGANKASNIHHESNYTPSSGHERAEAAGIQIPVKVPSLKHSRRSSMKHHKAAPLHKERDDSRDCGQSFAFERRLSESLRSEGAYP